MDVPAPRRSLLAAWLAGVLLAGCGGSYRVRPTLEPADPAPGRSAVPGRGSGGEPQQEHWRRRSAAAERALIREHLRTAPQVRGSPYWERFHRRARPWSLRAHGELLFPRRTEALDLATGSPKWPDLFGEGRGAGVEVAEALTPLLEPFLGVQYTHYARERRTLRQGQTRILQESEGLQTIPFYVGVRLRFPLNLPVRRWFSGEAAGTATGVIPYLRVAGGGAWSFGTGLEFTDLGSGVRSHTRFIDRGFAGYTELAAGVEYRDEAGYALLLSVGVQSYWGLEVDRRAALGRPDLRRLDQFFLPRVTAVLAF